ncbi:MAG: BamA/TamA family outer membrane protein [Sedimentisphaerales bacterium]|nr:BamA/TamA family outer membrane protein [Sedimentisphaerales bacterium]
MRNRIRKIEFLGVCLVFCISVLNSGCAWPGKKAKSKAPSFSAPAAAGRNVIRSLEFVGNHSYKDKVLSDKVGFEVGDYLDPILAETGRGIISDFYRQKGFPNNTVLINASKVEDGELIYIIDEGPRVQVKSVKFQGNSGLKTRSLRKAVKTSTRRWVVKASYYSAEKVAEDVERLKKIYYRRGYLNSSVRATGQSHIVFIIDEGPLYRVGDVVLRGNTRFSEAELLSGLKLERGEKYLYLEGDLHAKKILKTYRENGYVDSFVVHRPEFAAGGAGNVADVVFEITEGRQFRIGRVDVTGNESTQDKVIRHVLDEYGFSPGALYNAHMAPNEPSGEGLLEKYIQRMTLAEQAIIMPVPVEGDPNQLDAQVDITEGLTGMWNPGVGVGSDSGIIGHLIFQQRNFDIHDKPESFGDFIKMKSLKGAGQTLRIALEPGTVVSQYSVSFTEPYFRDKPTSLDVVGSAYERGRESYDEERLKGYVGFEERRAENWRRSIGFRAENVDVDGLEIDAPKEINKVKGSNALVGVRVGIGRDMTDDKYNPSEGYTFDTGYEQVGGDHTFGILSGAYIQYKTLHQDLLDRKTILATKFRAGATVGSAPPFEKFYGGGTGTYGIRGFEYRGVSTRGLQTNVPTPKRKDPIGSDWIFIANTEVAVPVVGENLSWLFFVDSGIIDTGGYRAALGTGIQILIPQWFGPVPMRFELAAPFLKDSEDDSQIFSFSVGGLLF